MTVSLSSLRVSSDFDSSGYIRGAAAKVAADERMIAADKARNASLAQADAALLKAIPGMSSISKALLDGYGAGQTFEGQIRRVGNALDRGMDPGRASLLLDALYRKFGLVADAAVLTERGFVSLAPAVQAANERFAVTADVAGRAQAAVAKFNAAQQAQAAIAQQFGIGAAPGRQARDSADAFLAEYGGVDGVARQRAQASSTAFGQQVDERLLSGVSKSARDSASVFEEFSRAEDQAAAKATALRAAINPLEAEMTMLGKEMAVYKTLLDQGVIKADEYAAAQVLVGKRLSDFERNLKQGATAGRVMSFELVNLSYQLNDVFTGLATGQSPFMILGQQGGQILQIFQGSKASVADFAREAGSKLVSFLTVGRLAFGGVAASAAVAVAALNDYATKQERVALGLIGAGRASGSTVAGINNIAGGGSSLTGLSVNEARTFAIALAQTGRIANDNILPIVGMGKDIARIFGITATEAAEMLAKAFADPVAGADQLNQRLGFLDASTQKHIANLVAQNKLWDAQRVLTAGAASGLDGVNAAVGASTKFWTALGNSVSNVWDRIGEGASRITGLGQGLDGQAAAVRARIRELEELSSRRSGSVNRYAGTTSELEQKRAKLDSLTASIERNSRASQEAQQRQFSFAQAAGVRGQLPEIEQVEKLRNEQELLSNTMLGVQATGGAASDVLKRLGLSYEQLAKALEIASGNVKTFKNEFTAQVDQLKIANDAITAFSPTAKGEIARRQSLESTLNSKMTPGEKAALGEQAYTNALKTANTALSEAARERALASVQATSSAKLEVDLVGQSISEQTRLRGVEQSRQQLQQESSRNRTELDNAQLQRLSKEAAEQGRLKQLEAERAALRAAQFEGRTALMPAVDQQIAQQLRQIYGDSGWQREMNGAIAQQMRFNDNLKQLKGYADEAVSATGSALTSTLADWTMGSKSAGDAFRGFGLTVVRSLEEMLIKMLIVMPVVKSLQSVISGSGGFLSSLIPGAGGSEAAAVAAGVSPVMANGGVFAGGNIVPFARGGVVNRPSMFPMANGAGLMGEAGPEAIMPLRRGPTGRLGVEIFGGRADGGNSTSISIGDINVSVPAGTGEANAAEMAAAVRSTVSQVVREELAYHSRPRGMLSGGLAG